MLEKIDEQLLRKLLKAPSKTPKEILFLELGCVPLRLIIRSKRMNLLHYILNQPEDSILKEVFNEQNRSPSRNDWVKLIQNDMKVLKIDLSYSDIQSMSKNSFKNFIKKR